MADTNNYQSGGKGYNSPDVAIAEAVRQLIFSQTGGANGLANMSSEEGTNALMAVIDKLAESCNLLPGVIEKLRSDVKGLENAKGPIQQQVSGQANSLVKNISGNVELMKGLQAVSRIPKNSNNPLAMVNNSLNRQNVHLNQKILEELKLLNKSTKKNEATEASLFDTLQQAVLRGIFNSPTAAKVGRLGASLMSAGLFRIAGNEKMPKGLRQAANLMVQFQVPQTLMNIIGSIFQLWLFSKMTGGSLKAISKAFGGAGKVLSGTFKGVGKLGARAFGNIGTLATKVGPALSSTAGMTLAGVAVTGIAMDRHSKAMKKKDEEIMNNSRLSQAEKDDARIWEHGASGAKAGAVAGATIGTFIGGPIGTVVGGAIGALGGAIIGTIKPKMDKRRHEKEQEKKDLEKGKISAKANQVLINSLKSLNNQTKIISNNVKQIVSLLRTHSLGGNSFTDMLSPFSGGPLGLFAKLVKGAAKSVRNWADDQGGQVLPSGVSTEKNLFGRPKDSNLVDLRDFEKRAGIKLKGTIAGENSRPWTTKQNVASMLALDNTLANANGGKLQFKYTSNMGGSHATGSAKSHAMGSKVDVVTTNGVISPDDYEKMYKQGWFGGNTGALGYEYINAQGKRVGASPSEYRKMYERGEVKMGNGRHYDLTIKRDLVQSAINQNSYLKSMADMVDNNLKNEGKVSSQPNKYMSTPADKPKMQSPVTGPKMQSPATGYTDISGMGSYSLYQNNLTESLLKKGQ